MPLDGTGTRVRISPVGGTEPIWSPDGGKLYFRGPSRMMAATIVRVRELAVARIDTLFADRFVRGSTQTNYDLFPNGDFLMVESTSGVEPGRLMGMAIWLDEAKRVVRQQERAAPR
jgi:hypothetical protein